MQALIPDWMRAHPEVYTWRSALPVVCFNFVHMHHIDRVIRQYGGEQPVPRLPVDVTRYMSSTGRGDDVWWPQRLSTWYEGWQRRRSPEVLVTVHFGGSTGTIAPSHYPGGQTATMRHRRPHASPQWRPLDLVFSVYIYHHVLGTLLVAYLSRCIRTI
ncbi:hypothetical protein PIB30_039789 [Stylosanthes scabra]|uniref:Uncharacterized protein n=1 Tax=Stylosanthes scabra TaxID=79078 RepID=A0ABU6XCW2_9FABA|nr:hypothetical protein [Stylosanthes scabra]